MVIAGEWDRRAEGHGSTARWVNRCDMKHNTGNTEREREHGCGSSALSCRLSISSELAIG